LALVFREDRRIALVRCKHFGAIIPRNDGVSGVKAEVNKEECHLRSDFFCAGYNPASVISEGDSGGRRRAQGPLGRTHYFRDANMSDQQPLPVAPQATRADLKLLLGGVRDNGRIEVEAAHLVLENPRNIRVVLGEGRKMEPDGRLKLTEGQRKWAQEKSVPEEVNVIEVRGKKDLAPKTDGRPSNLDAV
jgi:hypothetical protein